MSSSGTGATRMWVAGASGGSCLARQVSLFRTTAQWVESEVPRGGRRFSTAEMEALQRLRLQLDTVEGEDVRSAKELIDKLLETQIRIEQERY